MTMNDLMRAIGMGGRSGGAGATEEKRTPDRLNRYYPLEFVASDGHGGALVGRGSTVNIGDGGVFLICSDGLPAEGMWIAASMRVEERGAEPRNVTFTGRVTRVERFKIEGHPWEGQVGVAVKFDRAPRW